MKPLRRHLSQDPATIRAALVPCACGLAEIPEGGFLAHNGYMHGPLECDADPDVKYVESDQAIDIIERCDGRWRVVKTVYKLAWLRANRVTSVVGHVAWKLAALALALVIGACEPHDDQDAGVPCPQPVDSGGPTFCGDPGESCCVANVDGVAMLACHAGQPCAYVPEGHADPEYRGTCTAVP